MLDFTDNVQVIFLNRPRLKTLKKLKYSEKGWKHVPITVLERPLRMPRF